jgi:putative membrane protein
MQMIPDRNREEWLSLKPNEKLSRTLKFVTWIVTSLVLVLVVLMRRPELRIPLPEGVDLGFLPPFHAMVNSIVAILLVLAVLAVRSGNITRHRNLMMGAMGMSVIFLLGYVAYHFTNTEVLFGDANGDRLVDATELAAVGMWRAVYLVLLITHIVAAGVSLPLILLTFTAAWSRHFQTHRKLARWVFPIWLYVAVTGPICYLMLRSYYP